MSLREQLHTIIDRMGEQDLERALKVFNNFEEMSLNEALSRAGIGLPENNSSLVVPPLIDTDKTASEQLLKDRR